MFNFPDNPTYGQAFGPYTWDDEKWVLTVGGVALGPVDLVNTALPVISGGLSLGATLTTTSGTWTGSLPITYAYQWKRNGVVIGGATVQTYVIVAADAGKTLTVTVTAANPAGSASVTATGVVADVEVDPYWSSVVLMLGFDGSNGSTGMPDESSKARGNAATVNVAFISTAQSVAGGSSLWLSSGGGEDYITFPDSNDWDFGTGAFTLEGFFRFTTVPYNAVLMAQWSGGWAFYFESGGLKVRSGSISDTGVYNWDLNLNQWYHIAVDRDASSIARIYIDGVMKVKSPGWTPNLSGSGAQLAIGSLQPGGFSGYNFRGFADELRITKGVARYGTDSTFTIPTVPFPRV